MKQALFVLALAACVDHGPGPQHKKIEASYVRANLLAMERPESNGEVILFID